MKRLFLIIVSISFLLSGCSFVIEIIYDNSDRYTPTFYLKEKHIIFDRQPKVREILFYKEVDNRVDYSNPIWSIKADGIKIKKLTYGVLPEGFKIVSPADRLLPSTKYSVHVRAWGSVGFMEFQTPGDT